MSKKRPRVFGTTEKAIMRAEKALGFTFPDSYRAWLLQNNGLRAQNVRILPVLDDRDPRSTFLSIVHEFECWQGMCKDCFEGEGISWPHLLPFSPLDSGDYYCFDFSQPAVDGEYPIVLWRHETGESFDCAKSFSEFLQKAETGAFVEH